MAVKTADSVVARMALVPRVLEARGLDVTLGILAKLQNHGDEITANILKIIFEQEIGHVVIGSRWFNYACKQQGLQPEETFQALLHKSILQVGYEVHFKLRRDAKQDFRK